MKKLVLSMAAGFVALGFAAADAAAQGMNLLERTGSAIQVGGGVTNFTEDATQDQTDVGGYWDARLVFGVRNPIAVEAAYVGSAQDIQALGLDDDAVLMGNGLEANLRLNLPIERNGILLEPYVIGGLGFSWYTVVNEEFNTSSVEDDDGILSVPLGLGFAVGWKDAIFDARFTYRPAFGDDILGEEGDDNGLNNFSLAGMVGYRF